MPPIPIWVGAIALLGVVFTVFASIYIDRRTSTLRHAREKNPEVFQDMYHVTVSVKDAMDSFGDVWEATSGDPFEPLNHALYKILVSRINAFNRTLSPSLNRDFFFIPHKIEKQLARVSERLNQAIMDTDISSALQVRGETTSAETMLVDLNSEYWDKIEDLRFLVARRLPALTDSQFCDSFQRTQLSQDLDKIAIKIKKLVTA